MNIWINLNSQDSLGFSASLFDSTFISINVHISDRKELTEGQSESKGQKEPSFRRRLGKIALVIGLLVVASLITLGVFASLAAAYTGVSTLNQFYLNIAAPGFLIGFLLMIIGLIAALLPEGLSKDGLWSMQVGPYIR